MTSPTFELLDIAWITVCTALVIVMQGGFCCLESGLVRSKNSINVAIKSLTDFCLASVIFFCFGFAIMHGASQSGWFGTTGYFLEGITSPDLLSFFLLQMVFCGTAATIVSAAVAERMNFSGYVVIVSVVAGLIYPFVGHWVWGGILLSQPSGWLAQLGFIDFAGSTVVHSVGGWAALAATLVVGPRLGRFDSDSRKLHGHNLPMSVLGIVLLWFGWIGFNGGSALGMTREVPLIMVNTCLAAAFGGFASLVISWMVCGRSDVLLAMKGVIAGLVAISASCNIMAPSATVLIACIAAAVCFGASNLLTRLKIDDAIGAFASHACAGIWGTLAVALFGPLSAFGEGVTPWEQLLIQATGVGVCFGWSFGASFLSFWLINRLFRLRVSEEDERIGLNVTEHHASTEILDLLAEIESHQDGQTGQLIKADRHTEAGQIAAIYNRMAGTAAREREAAESIRKSEQRIRQIIDTANEGFVALDFYGIVYRWNAAAEKLFGHPAGEAVGRHIADVMLDGDQRKECDLVQRLLESAEKGTRFEIQASHAKGHQFPVEISASLCVNDHEKWINFFVQDITSRKELQQQLAQSQKLESIGQLAAGIAHEINTPIQFFGDNTNFLKDAFADLKRVTDAFERLVEAEKNGEDTGSILEELETLIDEVDMEYLQEEIPLSIEQSLDGVDRVASIVRAMKQFSHPGGGGMERVDLNKNIEDTITVSRNEWKYVAELERDFDKQLPPVPCFPNEFNQVVLNMIVNAAHAIQDKLGPNARTKGKITISTRKVDEQVEVRISDTGSGIPEEIRNKIFDPFFTTKEVGRGTGQGLAIAYKAIVDHHKGSIDIESTPGEGTTFIIRLGLQPPAEHSGLGQNNGAGSDGSTLLNANAENSPSPVPF